jgi:pilus assembly protein CpaB
MSIRTVLIVLVALAVAGLATLAVNQVIQINSQSTKETGPADTVRVVVASVQIDAGQKVRDSWLKYKQVPKASVESMPAGLIHDIDHAKDRFARQTIFPNEDVLQAKLSGANEDAALSSITHKNMRSVTLQGTDVASLVAGFVRPGDRADVMLTVQESAQDGTGGSTFVWCENVEIKAVDNQVNLPQSERVEGAKEQVRSVTLHVTPEQAALIAMAQGKGRVSLSLRNRLDDTTKLKPDDIQSPRPRLDFNTLAGKNKPATSPKPGPEGANTEPDRQRPLGFRRWAGGTPGFDQID